MMPPIATQAVVLAEARGPVTVRTFAVPEPGPGQALVKMEACGLCHSDLFVSGLEKLPLAPLILGHEGIGRIAALGPGVGGWPAGQRVGLTFLASTCGNCEWCRSGRERFCARQLNFGYSMHGALAGYAVAPVEHLVRVSEALPAEAAAPLCCAGWTAYGALRETGLSAGQSIALFGMGGLGHLAVQFARHRGLRVAAVDVSAEKLGLARACGAEAEVPADAAVVFTASPAAIQQAFRGLKRNATLVLVGLSTTQYELAITDTVLKGLTVRGSYLGTRRDLEEVFRLAEQGVVRTHTETHALAETPELLEKMRRGELLGRAVVSCA